MNNIVTNFDQILTYASQSGMPVDKKRGVLREYLQYKFIAILYGLPNANKLSFVGGTSLRLLRSLPRFSEDLDFDNLGLDRTTIKNLFKGTVAVFKAENIDVELSIKEKGNKDFFDLKFPNLLSELSVTTNTKEKMLIKLDYSDYWINQNTEVLLFSKYGFISNVVTNKTDCLLVQKLKAYVGRTVTQPRDIFDIVWLYSQGVRINGDFAMANGVQNIVQIALEKHKTEGITPDMKTKLTQFLFNPADIRLLDLFGDVLSGLAS